MLLWPFPRVLDTEKERDLAPLFFGEHTEHESSEQLLTLLADGDRRCALLCICGGDLGILGWGRDDVGGDRGEGRRASGERRDEVGGDRGERRPAGERRPGGERRPVGERDRLRRPDDGDDDPSKYIDL